MKTKIEAILRLVIATGTFCGLVSVRRVISLSVDFSTPEKSLLTAADYMLPMLLLNVVLYFGVNAYRQLSSLPVIMKPGYWFVVLVFAGFLIFVPETAGKSGRWPLQLILISAYFLILSYFIARDFYLFYLKKSPG